MNWRNVDKVVASYFVAWVAYFLLFWGRAITVNPAGGISVAHINLWGDWAIHFTMGSAMAYRDLFLDSNPLLIGTPFKYPAFVNFVSALLIRAGTPFFTAFTVPSFFFSVFIVWALFWFFRSLLGGNRPAVLASTVFLLNGGIGFLRYFFSILVADDKWQAILFPPDVYSHMTDLGFYWANVIQSMIIPQRAFQLGLPMGLTILAIVLRVRLFPSETRPSWWFTPARAAVLGVVYGFIPIIHAHAFICTGFVLLFWIAWDFLRSPKAWRATLAWWGAFTVGTAVMATPLVYIFYLGSPTPEIFTWMPGWESIGEPWYVFWGKNWGPALCAAVVGQVILLLRRGRRLEGLFLFAPFWGLFLASNLYIFHAWTWDNTKVIVWSSVGVAGLVAVACQALWSTGRFRAFVRPFCVLVVILVCLTGAIDVYRIQVPKLNRLELYSNEALYLADWARKKTPIDSIWLTGEEHRNWLYNLTGRQALETYTGWLWTHGYNYKPIDSDVEAMYADPTRDDLFRKYGVDYIMIGRHEKDVMQVDQEGFDRRFPVAIKTDNWTVYRYSTEGPGVPAAASPAVAPLPLTIEMRPGLIRRVYRGKYFFGKALIKEGDSDINFSYAPGDDRPFPSPMSIEWEGYLRVPERRDYVFSLESDDGSWLWIDNALVIDNGGNHASVVKEAGITLAPGYHHIRLRYFDAGQHAVLNLNWSSPDGNAGEGLFYPKRF